LVAAVAHDFSAQLRQAWQKGRMRREEADRGDSRLDPGTSPGCMIAPRPVTIERL